MSTENAAALVVAVVCAVALLACLLALGAVAYFSGRWQTLLKNEIDQNRAARARLEEQSQAAALSAEASHQSALLVSSNQASLAKAIKDMENRVDDVQATVNIVKGMR